MGDVVAMKRKVETRVRRFGHDFRVEYLAGVSPKVTDPMAAVYVDGEFFTWAGVSFLTHEWASIDLALDDDYVLVTPEMVGMSPTTEDEKDHRFLIEAEDYLLALLMEGLLEGLGGSSEDEDEPEATEDPRLLPPRERAARVVSRWHDHGKEEPRLPLLISLEIYDALASLGMTLADAVDEYLIEEAGERRECGEFVRALVDETLSEWQGGES